MGNCVEESDFARLLGEICDHFYPSDDREDQFGRRTFREAFDDGRTSYVDLRRIWERIQRNPDIKISEILRNL